MFRDPVLRRSVDEGDEYSRGERMPPGHQGEPTPAYHSSPTQTGQPYQHHHSPSTPAPVSLQPANLLAHHQHHRPPSSPRSTELPPISTALYPRADTSRYYDPTSDNGDRALGRDTARYDNHYPPQVRLPSTPAASLLPLPQAFHLLVQG